MKKVFNLIIVLSLNLIITGCKVDLDIITSPVNYDIPVSGETTGDGKITIVAERAIEVPEDIKKIEVENFIFDYALTNNSTKADMDIDIRISLYGEAQGDEVRTYIDISGTSNITGYSFQSLPAYLGEDYKDVIKRYNNEIAGWTSIVSYYIQKGTSINPPPVSSRGNNILLQIPEQKYIWIVVKNTATITGGTILTPVILNEDEDYVSLLNFTIEVKGFKETGFFPSFMNLF